jgi:hypothetical protein
MFKFKNSSSFKNKKPKTTGESKTVTTIEKNIIPEFFSENIPQMTVKNKNQANETNVIVSSSFLIIEKAIFFKFIKYKL